MRLQYGLTCDYAAEGRGGKHSAIGIFNQIMFVPTDALPGQPKVRHGRFFVVLSLAYLTPDIGKHAMVLRLRDEDGREVTKIDGLVEFGAPPIAGLEGACETTIELPGIQLPDAGLYEWEFSVGGNVLGTFPWFVVAIPAPAAK